MQYQPPDIDVSRPSRKMNWQRLGAVEARAQSLRQREASLRIREAEIEKRESAVIAAEERIRKAQKTVKKIDELRERTPRRMSRAVLIIVSNLTGITVDQIKSPRRNKSICRARHAAMWLLTRYGGLSLPEVGRRMGGRDHSTVLHGRDKVEANRQDFEPLLSTVIDILSLEA